MSTWDGSISGEELTAYARAAQDEADRFKAAGGPARLAKLIPVDSQGDIKTPSHAVLNQVLGMTNDIINSANERIERMRGT
jgi:hypothetical protein